MMQFWSTVLGFLYVQNINTFLLITRLKIKGGKNDTDFASFTHQRHENIGLGFSVLASYTNTSKFSWVLEGFRQTLDVYTKYINLF